MNYTIEYFIKKFEAIPDEDWGTNSFIGKDGTRCAMGLCGASRNFYTEESKQLSRIFEFSVTNINDGLHPNYQQSTPKERILQALRDKYEEGANTRHNP